MFGAPMRRGAIRLLPVVAAAAVTVGLGACGSGSPQDANAPSGTFPVQVTTAKWMSFQRLAQHTKLVIAVRNTGTKTIPNLAISICNTTCRYPAPVGQGTSVAAFASYLNMPGLASHSRPVWVIDQPPGACNYSCQNGGQGAYVSANSNTWQSGQLKPGATAVYKWRLTAVAPGHYVVAYQVAGDLYGKAKTVLPGGVPPQGDFRVTITRVPAQSFVSGSGKVVQLP
jgi:hypothetical protein